MKGNAIKKIFIGAITILFSLVLFSFIMISNAEEVTVVGTWDISADDGTSNVTATLYSDGRFLISGTGKMKDYSSTSDRPYNNNKLLIKTVEIQSGVTNIGDASFEGCTSLSSIEIPSSVTSIEEYAFEDCSSLEEIYIPNSVIDIGDLVFHRCVNLKNINESENNQNYISEKGILFNKDKTILKCYPEGKIEIEYIIPEGVNIIENGAFFECRNLTNIQMPKGLINIGDIAFAHCTNLLNIDIPDTVTNIGNNSFLGTQLTVAISENEIKLPEIIKRAMKEEDILYTANDFTLTNCSLSEDKSKLVVDTEVASKNTVSLRVTEGALNGLTVVVVSSGTITYSTTSWTKDDVTARIYVADGETIQNNDAKNTYTFTFQYLTAEGEERQVTATVENIEELAIKNYEVTEQNETKYLEGVKVGVTIQEVLNNIETNGTAKVYQEDTKITDENTKVATEMTIKITWGTADEETYTLVATGDLNGDGEMGDIDLLRLVRYQAGLDTNLNGAYFKAADIYKDGACADNKDLLKIARVLAGLDNL